MNTEIQQCSTKFTKTQWNQYIKYFSFLFYIFSIIFVFIVIWINLSKTACSTIWTLENQRLFRTLAIYFGTKKIKNFFSKIMFWVCVPLSARLKVKIVELLCSLRAKMYQFLSLILYFFFWLEHTFLQRKHLKQIPFWLFYFRIKDFANFKANSF